MAARLRASLAVLWVVLWAQIAPAQEPAGELTPAGKAILKRMLASQGDAQADLLRPRGAAPFPLPTCMFRGGLCGAVNRDGTVAVPPRYDWVGRFFDGRAAVRLGGLYGFVDEQGREIVEPKYRIVDDFKLGFAQVDVDGKSGLIDRDGKMAIAPKYGFIEAIAPDRFRVSDARRIGGRKGEEDFSGRHFEFTPSGGIRSTVLLSWSQPTGVIDRSGQWIEPPVVSHPFDEHDPSLRWVQKDKLWGLARADGTWVIEPKFQQADHLIDGLARVTVNGKVGFIDRTGKFAIEPVFDKAWWFQPGLGGRTSAARDGVFGVIDKTGAWIFQTSYQQVHFAMTYERDPSKRIHFGWHFKKADRWGLLDRDGRVLLDADFDHSVQSCADGRLIAYKNKEVLLFKSNGRPLQPPNGRFIDGGSCGGSPPYTLKVGDELGLVGADGTPVTPVQFEAIVRTGPQLRNVKLGGKWGRIGLDGRWVLEPKFDYLSNGTGLFVAAVDGKRGFMRDDGTWLIEPRFDAAGLSTQSSDAALVTISGATGLLRLKDQSWVIAPRQGAMCDVGDAIMSQPDGKRIILSPAGEIWIDLDAERIGTRLEGGLLMFLRNGKWGLVDTAGQVIVEPQYDAPLIFSRGVVWAGRGDRWCAIDRRGRVVPNIACADADPIRWPNRWFQCKVEQ
jgi:hypothetical protein